MAVIRTQTAEVVSERVRAEFEVLAARVEAHRPLDDLGLLQRALRSDPDIQAAVSSAYGLSGKPILVWNGDWLRDRRQEGKGLAGVRQAIAAEVAFAPKACRTQAVQGLVLISMRDGPGAPRLVLGSGRWRWSDLQFIR